MSAIAQTPSLRTAIEKINEANKQREKNGVIVCPYCKKGTQIDRASGWGTHVFVGLKCSHLIGVNLHKYVQEQEEKVWGTTATGPKTTRSRTKIAPTAEPPTSSSPTEAAGSAEDADTRRSE